MAKHESKATLSRGRAGWCVIFRHPICRDRERGEKPLRVRRGLGTADEEQARKLVEELNELLATPAMWSPAARESARSKFAPCVVGAFYDPMLPDSHDPWAIRNEAVPLPGGEAAGDGYVRAQFVGTTGAGKTTIVRQLLGTDPEHERFPSISAAKTTICDMELVFDEGPFRAVVTFIPRDRTRQYIAECVMAAVMGKLDGASEHEVLRRFLEHSEQRFRLSYVLGNPAMLAAGEEAEIEDEDEDKDVGKETDEVVGLSESERAELLRVLQAYLKEIDVLLTEARAVLARTASELGVNLESASSQDRDVLQEFVEDSIADDERFHELVDAILEDVEGRFLLLDDGEVTRGRDGWPVKWMLTVDSGERARFLRTVNRFSSNYAPNFGRLLTPLVEGIRVAGPFRPAWQPDDVPKLVLLDGQGIGHIADSSSSLSTSITRRFQLVDAIVLVDNAAQPMQAGSCAVLQSLVASGHESKLIVAFTHFDEVKGDNLIGASIKKDHVLGSFDNATRSIGKAFGRDAEVALRKMVPERVIFLANIQQRLKESAKLTRHELDRLLQTIMAAGAPAVPIEYNPVYDVANLVLAIQKATQEFHERWNGILGMGSKSGVLAEHWARVKALTRRLGVFRVDEYDTLRPVADLIRLLQTEISQFLASPLQWDPATPPDGSDVRAAAIDTIKKEVFTRLHDLSRRRVLDDRIKEWLAAYELRGPGSTRVRAREVSVVYGEAAPVPNEMPGPDANAFLFEVRELIADSIQAGGGKLRGWRRETEESRGT